MKVSVLVTFYNQENNVDRCLENIFNQKCSFDYEVLVGDDGSTDGTVAKVRTWQKNHPNLKLSIMPREDGVKYYGSQRASWNRMALLEQVTGEYFIYLDGDDFWCDQNKLQKQVDILDKSDNAGYVMCGHNSYFYQEENGSRKPMLHFKKVMKLNQVEYWGRYYIHSNALLIRSKYINRIPKDLIYDYFNDNLITYCFLPFGDVYYIPDLMVNYSQTGDGIWTGNSEYIGHLRNIISMNLEMRMQPQLKDTILTRYYPDMHYMVKTIGKQDETAIVYYVKEIEKDHLQLARQWLDVNLGKAPFKGPLKEDYRKSFYMYYSKHAKWAVGDIFLR